MIVIETPARALRVQRKGLQLLLTTRPDRREFVCGALAVLDWIEHGSESPLEQLSLVTARALAEDERG